ncbi:putative acetyltransferase [compost metagenome]
MHLDGPAGHLLDFIVEPAHRGLGHGRRALELMEARLRAEGAQSLQLRVAANNPRAQQLYEQAGLRVTGQLLAKRLA